jgi:hypothetical protein
MPKFSDQFGPGQPIGGDSVSPSMPNAMPVTVDNDVKNIGQTGLREEARSKNQSYKGSELSRDADKDSLTDLH